MKRWLSGVSAFLLLPPVLLLLWLCLTNSGLQWSYQQVEPYLPGKLTLAKLEGRLIGPITAKGVEYQQDGAVINADQLTVEWLPVALLTAKIDITKLHLQGLEVVLPPSAKTDQPQSQSQPINLPEIHLPWRMMLNNVLIDGVRISQNEQNFALQQIRLSATTLFSQVDIDELKIVADNFSLDIKGEVRPTHDYRHELEIAWQLQLPSKSQLNGAGQLKGDMKSSRISQQLTGPLQATVNADVENLLEQFNWQASVEVSKFDAHKLNPDWPAVNGKLNLDGKGDLSTATLVGNVVGEYPDYGAFDADVRLQRLPDSSIQFDRLMLHSPVNDTRIVGRGQWLPGSDGGDVSLALDWQQLRWPLTGDAWFDSAIGSGWLMGNAKHYQFGLASDRPLPQAPASFWYASANGNLDGLEFDSLRLTTLDGEVTAKGRLAWSPQLLWQAQLDATAINPASLWPEWPGQLNATATSRGGFENGQLVAAADISKLTGKLRGYPVALHGGLGWRDDGLDIDQLEFKSGTSQVSANGRLGETIKLDWRIVATDLAELYPQVKGQLKAEGQLSGSQTAPLIKASINGQSLSLPGYEIGSLDAAIAVDLLQWQQLDLKLAAESLDLNGYVLQSLKLDADDKQLTAEAVSDAATAVIELKGKVDAMAWNGQIVRAEIQSQRYDNWSLKAPARLNINKNSLNAEAACWHNQQQASLCASLQRDNDKWQSQLEMNKLPLLLAGPWLPADLKLEGLIDAKAELQLQGPGQLFGKAHIILSPGAINYPLLVGERDRWEYGGGNVDVVLNQQGLTSSAQLAMNNGDKFYGQLDLPGLNLLALDNPNQPLQATAQLSVHDMGLIEAIVPEVYDLRGEMELNLSAAGTLKQPQLKGRAYLHNGAFRVPRLGLNIDQVSMDAKSEGFEKLNFVIKAHSGDGNLAIQGQTMLDRGAGWPTVISVKGNEFEVARIPEAQVQVSPDLQVNLQRHLIDIKGKVHVPYAKLEPKDVTTAVRVSEDTVIVGAEQTTEEKWTIVTSIRLTLGERVYFYGFGFDGRLGGSLLLQDEPGQLTTATGEINIPEGRYRAYGQRLDVEHGRLLYTGGPLSNPGLDLRAVRYVSNVTAGLKVRGSFNQPQIDLFSIPAMGQTDTLAYLLLGRPIENTSNEEGAMMAKAVLALGLSGGDRLARTLGNRFGLDEMRVESSDSGDQASLVMGRYLSPKLYISYGVGLIESINTFGVRYQISDKWQLKGESGEHQGADFLYTIER